jgi:heme-binding protein
MLDLKLKRSFVKKLFASLVIILAAIQLVPLDRTNHPVETEVPATAEARAVLRRACYDCHSNETVWPWYSRIAPMSWLVAWDVFEGRKELNFSTWNRLTAEKRVKAMHECWKEVEEGEMPPWFYRLPHPEARLSAEDRSHLRAWSLSASNAASNSR